MQQRGMVRGQTHDTGTYLGGHLVDLADLNRELHQQGEAFIGKKTAVAHGRPAADDSASVTCQ